MKRHSTGYNERMARTTTTQAAYVQPYRYASPNIPLSAIKRFSRRIAGRFHPRKIILFGSYAYGKPHAESDVDLLVIMPASDVVNMAIRISLAFEHPFSMDLIVRTPEQIARGIKDNDWFLREIGEKGLPLYEAKDVDVGVKSGGRLGRSERAGSKVAAAARRGVLSLPASSRKVPEGPAAGKRRRRSKDT
jgi:predicted nucleotidyltransferase